MISATSSITFTAGSTTTSARSAAADAAGPGTTALDSFVAGAGAPYADALGLPLGQVPETVISRLQRAGVSVKVEDSPTGAVNGASFDPVSKVVTVVPEALNGSDGTRAVLHAVGCAVDDAAANFATWYASIPAARDAQTEPYTPLALHLVEGFNIH